MYTCCITHGHGRLLREQNPVAGGGSVVCVRRRGVSIASFAAALVTPAIVGSARTALGTTTTLENRGFRLIVDCSGDEVHTTLDDLQSGLRAADGPMVYTASRGGTTHARGHDKLVGAARHGKRPEPGDPRTAGGTGRGADVYLADGRVDHGRAGCLAQPWAEHR